MRAEFLAIKHADASVTHWSNRTRGGTPVRMHDFTRAICAGDMGRIGRRSDDDAVPFPGGAHLARQLGSKADRRRVAAEWGGSGDDSSGMMRYDRERSKTQSMRARSPTIWPVRFDGSFDDNLRTRSPDHQGSSLPSKSLLTTDEGGGLRRTLHPVPCRPGNQNCRLRMQDCPLPS